MKRFDGTSKASAAFFTLRSPSSNVIRCEFYETQFKGAQAKEACACGTEVGGSWFIERSSLFYTKVGFLVGLSIGPKVARPSPPPRPASRRALAGGAVGTGGGGCQTHPAP
jgi:hypothetical protein